MIAIILTLLFILAVYSQCWGAAKILSPFIIGGIIITVIAYMFGLLNPTYMLILFLVYAIFGSLLTVISYLARNFLSDTHLSLGDVIKAFLLCIPENIGLRFIMAWTRLMAIFSFKKKKASWGQIKRYKINYNTKN